MTLVVHDTSSRAPVELAARHVVIPRAGEDGTREVLDLVLLRNAGVVTRVAPDSLGASWLVPLPPESEGLDLGESDVSPDAVVRRGDSAVVSAPISPGEKRIALQYHLPSGGQDDRGAGRRQPVAANVLLEEPGATAVGRRAGAGGQSDDRGPRRSGDGRAIFRRTRPFVSRCPASG